MNEMERAPHCCGLSQTARPGGVRRPWGWALVAVLLTACGAGHDADPRSHGTEEPAVEPPPEAAGELPLPGRQIGGSEHVEGFGVDTISLPDVDCKGVRDDSAEEEEGLYPVPLPPFSKDVFPCTRCHDTPDDFNMTKRNLTTDHLDIKLVHGPREQWCYGCHNPTDRDKLRLAGGRLIEFGQSYELCGQCHGTKLRDWRLGIHGRRTGCWNGKQTYRLCVHCHNPHAPKFKPVKPKPAPTPPSEIK